MDCSPIAIDLLTDEINDMILIRKTKDQRQRSISDKIIAMAKEYKFYEDYIPNALMNRRYHLRDWGFIIYGKNIYAENMLNIEFIFIVPQHRRKGILTKICKTWKRKFDIISFTSSESSMNAFAMKENFYDGGICRSGNERFYIWSEKYAKDKLMRLY